MFFPNKFTLLNCSMRDYIKQSIHNSIQKKMDDYQKIKKAPKITKIKYDYNIDNNYKYDYNYDSDLDSIYSFEVNNNLENKLINHNKIFTITFTLFTWSIYFLSKYIEKHI